MDLNEKVTAAMAIVGGVILLALIAFGIGSCTGNAMDREAACMAAGGTIANESGDFIASTCVDRNMIPVPGVENWRN